MITFIFKKMDIYKIGGLLPKNTNILSEKGDYYLGEIDEKEFWNIKIFQPIPVSNEIKLGFPLIGITKIFEEMGDSFTERELTSEELSNKQKAELFLEKLEIRSEITAKVGDNNDLIADINKRISLLERIVYQTFDFLYNSSELVDQIPSELHNSYGALLNDYVNKVELNELKDSIDLENVIDIYNKIINRINTTSNICSEYISKKE